MTPRRSLLSLYLDRFSPPEGLLLLVLAVFVGAITGLASVFFVKLIFAIQDFFYGTVAAHVPYIGKGIYWVVPIAGGLLVGPLILFAQEAKGSALAARPDARGRSSRLALRWAVPSARSCTYPTNGSAIWLPAARPRALPQHSTRRSRESLLPSRC